MNNTINQLIHSIIKSRSPSDKPPQDVGAGIEYLRFFFEHVPAAIAILDNQLRYVLTSRRWLEDYKLGNIDLTGRQHYDVFPELPQRWKEVHKRCLAGAVEKCDEDLFVRKDGSKQWVHWEIHPWYLKEGVIGGIAMFTQEITQRKHIEEELRESRSRLRQIIDLVPHYIFIKDITGKFLLANKAHEELYGLPADQLEGKNHADLHKVKDEVDRFLKDDREVITSGKKKFIREETLVDFKGLKHILQTIKIPYADFAHKEPVMLGVAVDITDLKKKEEELKEALKEKEVLLQEVNHRVKNNLQMVASLFDLQIDAAEDEKVRKVLERNQERIQAIALVHEMLFNSQELATLDFSIYMKNLIKVLFRAYCSDPQKIILDCRIHDINLTLSYAVPLGLIVNEVMSNSLRYAFLNNAKGGTLTIHFHPVDNHRYELVIKDDGLGLPEGFDLRKVKSLGLQIVCALTDQLHGEMTFTTNQGTEFRMCFNGAPESKGG